MINGRAGNIVVDIANNYRARHVVGAVRQLNVSTLPQSGGCRGGWLVGSLAATSPGDRMYALRLFSLSPDDIRGEFHTTARNRFYLSRRALERVERAAFSSPTLTTTSLRDPARNERPQKSALSIRARPLIIHTEHLKPV